MQKIFIDIYDWIFKPFTEKYIIRKNYQLCLSASHIRALVCVSVTPLVIQLSAYTLGKATEDGLSTWVPATHLGDMDRVLGSWIHIGSTQVILGHLGNELANG